MLAVVERDDHIGGYGVHAEKIRTAGVPILTDTIIKCASGKTSVEGVTTVKLADGNGAEDRRKRAGIHGRYCLLWLSVWLRSPSFCGTSAAALNSLGELGGYVPLA